jgi:hypothetical protein
MDLTVVVVMAEEAHMVGAVLMVVVLIVEV